MGAYDQITRIKNNVTASLSVVQEKGVSVPAGANSDNLPGLIAQISGGDASVEEITNEAGGKSVYINSEVPKLPEGYTRLQWIQSTGKQYVDTGFKPNQNTRVVMDLQGATTTSGVYMHYGVPSFMAGKASSGSWNYYVYYNTQEVAYSTRTASDFTARHTIDQNKNVITTGADTRTLTAATFSSGYNMYLFGVNNNGSLAYASPIKVFSCQIYDNGTLVRDYVPCKNAGGAVGLYDFVNGVFYADAAGGAFVAGPVMLDYTLPDGYEELEYIQSDGRQYINTGYTPNSNTRVVLDAYNLSASSGWTFGAWTSSNSLQYAFSCIASYSFRYGSTGVSLSSVPVGPVSVDFNKNAYNLNGTSGTLTAASFTCAYPMYLFAINAAGAVSGGKFTGCVNSCQIYDNGTLVRYYVPCRNASGVVGLWDVVNGVFYADAAGVGFVAGPVVGKSVSKVVLEDQVLIDLTSDTVTPEALLSGFTAHDAMGQMILGAASAGRPFATGTFTPSSTTASMVISGLNFKAKIVAVFKASGGVSSGVVMAALVDTEIGIGVLDWAEYDYSYWLSVARRTWSAANVKISATDTGFTFSVPTPFGAYPYAWYAIG